MITIGRNKKWIPALIRRKRPCLCNIGYSLTLSSHRPSPVLSLSRRRLSLRNNGRNLILCGNWPSMSLSRSRHCLPLRNNLTLGRNWPRLSLSRSWRCLNLSLSRRHLSLCNKRRSLTLASPLPSLCLSRSWSSLSLSTWLTATYPVPHCWHFVARARNLLGQSYTS